MGDADVAGGGGASSLDSGDAGSLAASRALMEGGSLPPRKRLLAGLKQNGWLSTSPPPVVSPSAGGYAGGVGAQALGGGDSAVRKYEDGGCMGCNAAESSGMRRIKRGGVSLRLCSACTLLYSKSMFCPHCLAMYHDASLLGDPSMWLVCTRCRRSVHPECEQKHLGSAPDPASYVCLDCVNSARRQREANGVTGMRSKHSSMRPVPGFHGEARTASPAGLGGDFVSPALKKPRMSRERSSRPGEHERTDGSRHRSGLDATKGGGLVPPRKLSSQPQSESASPQEAAVAARNAANAAAKLAAAAKANAAAKAAASVRAAAVAKAALEAAAHASRADAAARVELRKKLASGEARVGGGGPMRLEINVHSEPRRERSSKSEMKYEREHEREREDGYVPRRTGPGSVADEELARQLHRVINSSPRISRSMTPMRRKASVKPETPSSGVSNSSADTVRVRPRTSPAEPAQVHAQVRHEQEQQLHPIRHQQTRPRSVTHKEFRRIESRVSRHEVKTAEEGNGQQGERVGGLVPSSEEAPPNNGGGHSAVDLGSGVKNEGMDAVMFAPEGVQDEVSILFEALVEGEGTHAAGEGGQSHGRKPDYLQEILEAAVLTDSAMFHDGTHEVVSDMETLRSEPEMAEQGQETLVASGLDEDANEGEAKVRDGDAGEDVALEATILGLQEDMETLRSEPEMAERGQETLVASGFDEDRNEGEAKGRHGDAGEDVALEAVTLGLQEENQSTVLHDVEMEDGGGCDASAVVGEDPTSEPAGMMEPRSEERPSGESAEENMTGAGASKEIVIEAVASEETVSEADASRETMSEADTSIERKRDAYNETIALADTGIAPMDTSIDFKPDASDETVTVADTRIEPMDTSIDLKPDASNETMAVADTNFELKSDASNEIMAVADTSLELRPDASNETVAVADTSLELRPDASNETVAVADSSVELKPDANSETMAVADTRIVPQPDASNETMAVGADTSLGAKPDASSETVAVADASIEPQIHASNDPMAVADTSIKPKPDASNETMAVGSVTSIVAKPDVSCETMAVADASIMHQLHASNESMAVVADTKPDASNENMAVTDAKETRLRNAGADKVAKTIADAILAGANLTSLVEVGVSTVSGEIKLGGGERTASRGAAMGSSATEQSG